MRRLLPFCVLASTLLTLSACQQARNLDEMHDTTNEMRDITRDMRDETRQMNQTTNKMGKATNSMNESMQSMLTTMGEMNTLMRQLIQNTGDMNQTTKVMNGSLLDMKASMDVMRVNTETLASKMDHLAKVTESNLIETNSRMKTMTTTMKSMDATTKGMCTARNPQAADMRVKGFAALQNEAEIEAKVVGAMTFTQAMEFQNWGICPTDTLATRDTLFVTGLQEFFAKAQSITSTNKAAKALASSYTSPSEASIKDTKFNALAYAIEGVHDQQKLEIPKYNKDKAANAQVRVESIMSLIVESYQALKAKQPLKPWQKLVIANNATALRILQARHNFLIAAMIGKMKDLSIKDLSWNPSKLSGTALLNGLSLRLNKLIAGHAPGTTWSADISTLKAEELDEATGALARATETREILKAIGAKPVLDQELAPFVHNLSITEDKRGPAELAAARARFIRMVMKVQKDL